MYTISRFMHSIIVNKRYCNPIKFHYKNWSFLYFTYPKLFTRTHIWKIYFWLGVNRIDRLKCKVLVMNYQIIPFVLWWGRNRTIFWIVLFLNKMFYSTESLMNELKKYVCTKNKIKQQKKVKKKLVRLKNILNKWYNKINLLNVCVCVFIIMPSP